MSKCSKKCNEIKAKIDSISGLDDDYIYDCLNEIENFVKVMVYRIEKYADENELNGTCFNSKTRFYLDDVIINNKGENK